MLDVSIGILLNGRAAGTLLDIRSIHVTNHAAGCGSCGAGTGVERGGINQSGVGLNKPFGKPQISVGFDGRFNA